MHTQDIVTGEYAEKTREWNATDCMLYAVGVGAGSRGLGTDLHWATENSEGVAQAVVPTFGFALVGGEKELLDHQGWSENDVLLMSESIRLARPLPCEGRARVVKRVDAVEPHRRGLRIALVAHATDAASGDPLFTTQSYLLLRLPESEISAAERGPRRSVPAMPPDAEAVPVRFHIAENQALIYRLSSGRNPLHSDPVAARRAGYEQAILHGRCTFGYCAREIARVLGDQNGDAQLASISGRCTAPVWPGETLLLRVWRTAGAFDLRRPGSGERVLSRGTFEVF